MRVRPELEKQYHDCRIRLDNDNSALKICSRIMLIACAAAIVAIGLYITLAIVIIALTHKIIEAEIFIYGCSDLLLEIDFALFYGSVAVLVLFIVLTLINVSLHVTAVNVILVFAMPLTAVFGVVCLVTGRGFPLIYVIMLIYSVAMFVVQLVALHASSDLDELKRMDGYPQFNPMLIDDKSGKYSGAEWSKLTADEKIMAEREGYFRGR